MDPTDTKKQTVVVTPPENGGESKINEDTDMNIDSDEDYKKTIKGDTRTAFPT